MCTGATNLRKRFFNVLAFWTPASAAAASAVHCLKPWEMTAAVAPAAKTGAGPG